MTLSLQADNPEVTAYCKEISNPNVCEQIINEVNNSLRSLDEV